MNYQERPPLGFLAILYLLFVLSAVTLFLVMLPFTTKISIESTIDSGLINKPFSFMEIISMSCSIGLLLAPSFFFKSLSNIYRVFPWLLPLIILASLNSLIMLGALVILNHGFEFYSPDNHGKYIFYMLTQLIVCRLLMCCYFYFKPLGR